MTEQQEMVRRFMEKHGMPLGIDPGDDPETDLVRVHLVVEEAGELALALAKKDREKTADALGDLLYVVLGLGATYAIPSLPVFLEIHRSNMTKAPRRDRDVRLRDKGAAYVPPDIGRAIAEWREAERTGGTDKAKALLLAVIGAYRCGKPEELEELINAAEANWSWLASPQEDDRPRLIAGTPFNFKGD